MAPTIFSAASASSMLTLPLCGEPRCAYCYVRSDNGEAFEDYITRELSFACELKKSRDMILEGYFGLGQSVKQLEFGSWVIELGLVQMFE